MHPDLPFLISLTQVPQVGPIHARILLQHFGSAEEIFKSSIHAMEMIEGIEKFRAHSIKSFGISLHADKEIVFLQRYNIRAFTIHDPDYPKRLYLLMTHRFFFFTKGVQTSIQNGLFQSLEPAGIQNMVN
jgi:DNA processing protein